KRRGAADFRRTFPRTSAPGPTLSSIRGARYRYRQGYRPMHASAPARSTGITPLRHCYGYSQPVSLPFQAASLGARSWGIDWGSASPLQEAGGRLRRGASAACAAKKTTAIASIARGRGRELAGGPHEVMPRSAAGSQCWRAPLVAISVSV